MVAAHAHAIVSIDADGHGRHLFVSFACLPLSEEDGSCSPHAAALLLHLLYLFHYHYHHQHRSVTVHLIDEKNVDRRGTRCCAISHHGQFRAPFFCVGAEHALRLLDLHCILVFLMVTEFFFVCV